MNDPLPARVATFNGKPPCPELPPKRTYQRLGKSNVNDPHRYSALMDMAHLETSISAPDDKHGALPVQLRQSFLFSSTKAEKVRGGCPVTCSMSLEIIEVRPCSMQP